MNFLAKIVGLILLGLVTLSVISICVALFAWDRSATQQPATITTWAPVADSHQSVPPPAVAMISTDGAILESPPDVIYPPMPAQSRPLVSHAKLLLVTGVAAAGGLALWLMGWLVNRSRGSHQVEVELMQQIHSGLTRMESRVESLETLVVDAEKESPVR